MEDQRRVEEEEEAAAREAASIGGEAGDEDLDPADRPVIEGGGGVAEGFEQAEDDLIEHASHGDEARDPGSDAFAPESEDASATYGDPDRISSTGVREQEEPEEERRARP